MRALGRALVGRGHRATFVGMPEAEPLSRESGIDFHPVGLRTHPPGTLAAVTGRMAAVEGFVGLRGIIRDVAAATAMLLDELPDALRSLGCDLVVCDGTEAAGGLVAAHLGLPFVTVANALPLNREPAVPPAFTGWRYDPSRWGIERNAGGYRVADGLMRGHRDVIEAAAARWGLGARRHVADCLSPFAQISQTVQGLDFPRQALPSVFHHVGPLRYAASRPSGAADVVPAEDGRPLAFASLGTLQGGRASLFRRIAGAADRLGVRLVLAHGGRLDVRAVAGLPGSPSVHAFVDQDSVLARADLAILNGGLNTVMDSLARGVPIVALPIAFEQAAIAARLERAGAGRTVRRRFLTTGRLARALDAVLRAPGCREAAGRLSREVAGAGGVARAADIVETVLRTGRPAERQGSHAPFHADVRCQAEPERL